MDFAFTALSLTRPSRHVILATLNRPEAANAMNTALGTEIMTLFEALNLDAGETRCVVLTGAGDRAFCAGADLKERRGMSDEAWTRRTRRWLAVRPAIGSVASPRSVQIAVVSVARGPITSALRSDRRS
jgi:enoyl-CoA hydratase/carnithine racemase